MSQICNKCGAELEEGALFCGSCGAKTEPAVAEPEEKEASHWTDEPEAESPSENQPPEPTVASPADTQQPRGSYLPPVPPQEEGKTVSVANWLCRDLINLIPCVGTLIYIIMLFVWAFDKKYDETSRNWAKARLIFMAVCIVIAVVAAIVLVGYLFSERYVQGSPAPQNPYFFFDEAYGY